MAIVHSNTIFFYISIIKPFTLKYKDGHATCSCKMLGQRHNSVMGL